ISFNNADPASDTSRLSAGSNQLSHALKRERAAACATALPPPVPLDGGLADGAAGLREAGIQVRAQRADGADDHDGDEGDDEAVLDGRGARFVLGKTRNELRHA